jgi:hypothetical protein
VSGTEVELFRGDLVMGSMTGAMKAFDLRRDGRFALHTNPGDGSLEGGDAKLDGVAVELTDQEVLLAFIADRGPPEPFHLFRLDLVRVTLTSLHPDGDRLVIRTWRPGQGETTIDRR